MIKKEEILYLQDELMENFIHLHKNPELGFKEVATSRFILDKLKEYGIEAKQMAITGVMATIYGEKKGKTIAIRSDMDALPIKEESSVSYTSENIGVMHACGHDSHMSMLLAAAKYLNENRSKLSGNVRLIFQPAEEGLTPETRQMIVQAGGSEFGGAASMVKLGALKDVDAFFAIHVFPDIPENSLVVCRDKAMASCDKFELTIQGKGGHGSAPDNAVDPTGALAAILAAFNQLPSREFSALDSCVVTVGTVSTDSAWNIIPDKFQLTCSVRTYDEKIRDQIFVRLPEIAEHICIAHRCTAISTRTKMALPTINNPIISKKMVDVANRIFGEGKGILTDKPLVCSEDVAYYINTVPGAIGFLSVMTPDGDNYAAHNPKYCLNTECLINGVLFHINMAKSFLEQQEEDK